MDLDANLVDKDGYLERMSKPLQEKLRVANYVPQGTKSIVDVGCADGAITEPLSVLLPHTQFLGIDLNQEFIERAQKERIKSNLRFESIYLRELLAREQKYDAVLFTSVLHEFYSYGEGISSVLKALADAHELLEKGGHIIIRDMVFPEHTKQNHYAAEPIVQKVRANQRYTKEIADFEKDHGNLDSIYRINHFLLKYWYDDNWERECKEHYVPVTLEQYQQIFELLGMELIHRETYTIPFLKEKWATDFGFTEVELGELRSTSILVARKI